VLDLDQGEAGDGLEVLNSCGVRTATAEERRRGAAGWMP
jgi:hypothetical protein